MYNYFRGYKVDVGRMIFFPDMKQTGQMCKLLSAIGLTLEQKITYVSHTRASEMHHIDIFTTEGNHSGDNLSIFCGIENHV